MTENQCTPKKIYNREISQSACRLCATATDKKNLFKLFSVSGINKDLIEKIKTVCNFSITHDDPLQKSICRKCKNNVEKSWNFIKLTQAMQIVMKKQISVKRMHKSTPSTVRNKRKKTKNIFPKERIVFFNKTFCFIKYAYNTII